MEMEMKTKRILVLMLAVLLLFTACDNISTSGYWESWIKDIPEGEFEKADSESFVLEQDGFSVEFTTDMWRPTRGSGEYVLHPANNQIPLPKQKPSDCVIPFVITATTTTKDDSFATEFYFGASASEYVPPGRDNMKGYYSHNEMLLQSYTCDLSRFETQLLVNEKYFNDMKQHQDDASMKQFAEEMQPMFLEDFWPRGGGNIKYIETKPGDIQTLYGYYLIKDYYSSDFPDGNADILQESGALIRLSASFDGTGGTFEDFYITILEK